VARLIQGHRPIGHAIPGCHPGHVPIPGLRRSASPHSCGGKSSMIEVSSTHAACMRSTSSLLNPSTKWRTATIGPISVDPPISRPPFDAAHVAHGASCFPAWAADSADPDSMDSRRSEVSVCPTLHGVETGRRGETIIVIPRADLVKPKRGLRRTLGAPRRSARS
jgi:hypothetical protein